MTRTGAPSSRSRRTARRRPNILLILVDDLRYDEFGAGGHPYMKTPHIDRIAREGALFERAFHTTPICSPNRACILTGQYASRHGIIDNVSRDQASHRLANFHVALQHLGYETAHVGKWHMGNDASPRPGYDRWVSFRGQGQLVDPELWEDGGPRPARGYVTDLLNERAVAFVREPRARPFALFLAHKAVHPDIVQRGDGRMDPSWIGGYVLPDRHRHLYEGCVYPPRPSVRPPAEVVEGKPALRALFEERAKPLSQEILAKMDAGTQEEIRKRAAMMASVDEGVGMLLDELQAAARLDETFILFLGDNGFFFGEHGLTVERRFAYEEGIRTPFLVRFPAKIPGGSTFDDLVLALDIAPTVIDLAGGRPGPHIQGRSLVPLLEGQREAWRTSFLIEYYSEGAWP
ncbi:MAG TPA: sulfatase-like hydrolase/transferase, partial [Solirubrobacterales bacterium]|nr:sulfatase-like hydrolase/transferase [Solirubrobacterales bacterium]